MEVRRATAPANAGERRTTTRPGNGRGGADGNSDVDNQGMSDLGRRRLANDPAMMKELKRYRQLMLLTLLPAITTSEGDSSPIHPLARNHLLQDMDISPTHHQLQSENDLEDARNHNTHLPRPEPTDGLLGVKKQQQQQISPKRQEAKSVKSAGGPASREAASHSHGTASAGTRLPQTVYNPFDASPPRRSRRKSFEENSHRRRKSYADDRPMDTNDDVADFASGSGGSTSSAAGVGGSGGSGGELDLLTLAALYLESRHRVFGQEWHHRTDNLANTRPNVGVGTTGIARPRRLTPISPSDSSNNNFDLDGNNKSNRSFSAVIPAPGGLHLSVNYTQNLDLVEATYMAERARALRPRLRRLNSLDDLIPQSQSPLAGSGSAALFHRATSAPDLSQSANHGRRPYTGRRESEISMDSISPSLVTPARANTPTGAKHSAALVRPQMVGGSLATYSAVETNSDSSFSSDLTSKHPQNLSEVAQSALSLPARANRLLRASTESKLLDLPCTPPPTANVGERGESMRKVGKIHLAPLPTKKSSI